ncbi:formyltetrahydrofolate deformylase [soil metagenome]
MPTPHTATLLTSCPDRQGLVRAIARFINEHDGNILHLDQHVDQTHRVFFMRVEWERDGFDIPDAELPERFAAIASSYQMEWSLHFSEQRPRVAIFVSHEPHCLYDLLARHAAGELPVEIPLVVGNHETLRPAAERFDIPFHHFPITRENKAAQEAAELALLAEHRVDTVVLARYMQIVTPEFIGRIGDRIINIHHSFLPAFAGARPYHQAYERGFKIIGATAHYVTAQLDEGPIIAQDVIRVTHEHAVPDLVRQGKDLEKIVLARAVWAHALRKVLVHGNRTIVFP